MWTRSAAFLILFLAFMGVAGGAAEIVQGLSSTSLQQRTEAYEKVVRGREETVAGLLTLLQDEESLAAWTRRIGVERAQQAEHNPKTAAVRLLGDMRAPQAVSVLLDRLAYEDVWTLFVDEARMDTRYPAATSLAKIGMPAVRPAIDHIKVAKDDLERRLSVWILVEVEGVAVTRLRLQHELQVEEKSLFRHRLRKALGVLERLFAAGCPEPMQWEAGAWERAQRKADQTGAESTP